MTQTAFENLRDCQTQLDADGCMVGVSRQALDEVLTELENLRDSAAKPTPTAEPPLPDRESFWLVERNTSPPQFVSTNSASWHSDVWQAQRFNSERAAHDYWRMMTETDRRQFKVVEHLFINKPDAGLAQGSSPEVAQKEK